MPLPPPQLLLLLLLLQQTHCSASACEGLTCFADFLQTLTCSWAEGLRPFRATPYNLTAKWDCGEGGTCHFLPTPEDTTLMQFTCLAEQKLCFGENIFDVMATETVAEPSREPKRCGKPFLFKRNIKPQPPFNLTVVASSSGYNISWKTPYQHRQYNPLNGCLRYELRYRKRGHSWQGQSHSQKHLQQDTGALWLLPHEFEGGAEYELQVRARPAPSYQGTWSSWSPPSLLTTLPKPSDSPGDASMWLLLLSLFPALLAFLGQRLWKKLDRFVPSPAPFFQPLFVGHNGDFKKWVGIPGTGATLDVFERGPGVGPEAFGTGSFKLLPLSPGEAECRGTGSTGTEQEGPLTTPTSPLPAAEGHEEAAQEQPYGRLSIDTVTVAGEVVPCCPQCDRCAHPCCVTEQPQQEEEEGDWEEASARDAYRRIHCEGHGRDGQFPGTVRLAERALKNPIPISSWLSSPLLDTSIALPPFQQAGGTLGGGGPGEGALFFFGPPQPPPLPLPEPCLLSLGCLCAPEEETPFYSTLLALHLEADDEGDPENGLDLDTIDSGFADCDCGSPLDTECEGRPMGGQGGAEREEFLPSYVKQWVSGHRLKA